MGRTRLELVCVFVIDVSFGPVPVRHLIGMPADKEKKEEETLRKTFPAGSLQMRMDGDARV